MGPTARTVLTVAAAGAAGLGWALTEAHAYMLRRAVVPVLEPGQRPLRVLHISDLHLTPTQGRKVAWVRQLAELEPDLVVNTGDNMGHRDVLPTLLHALEPLLDVPGVFVMGSNDYVAPIPKNPARYLLPDSRTDHPAAEPLPAAELADAMRTAGWKDLRNRRDAVVLDGRRVTLVGTGDAHIDEDRFPGPVGAGERGDVHLGVTHAPYRRVLAPLHEDGCDLVLAGHTHGGQLCMPFWGALVTNCDLDTTRAKGLHGWPGVRPDLPGGAGSTWLHVSAGLGTSPYAPVRFACRPEATLLTLVAKSSRSTDRGGSLRTGG